MTTLDATDLVLDRGGFRLDLGTRRAEPGRLLVVTGPSGAGKTTLLALLGGLLAPTSGSVTYAGEPVAQRGGRPHPAFAFALQSRALVGSLTAAENTAIALRAHGVAATEATARATAALVRLGIGDLADRMIGELSGGQVQRVSVARALAAGADVLLLDEPTSELDEANRDLTVAAAREEAERGAIVVVTTNDPEVAEAGDDELRLDAGQVVEPPPEPEVTGPEAFMRPGSRQ